MEFAKSAMERVPLNDSPTPSRDMIPQPPVDANMCEDAPRFMLPVTRQIHRLFRALCHTCGAFTLRVLSLLMLHGGVLAAVALQLLSFYDTGVLNGHLFLACLFYAPSIAGMAILREHMLHHGTSFSGTGPRMSHMVALAYMIMVIGGICSVLQPVLMRLRGALPLREMGISIAGTGTFYYCLLVSEVLLATALNVDKARIVDEELRRRDREDPAWVTGYQAIHSADV